jgi:hypothetical protein
LVGLFSLFPFFANSLFSFSSLQWKKKIIVFIYWLMNHVTMQENHQKLMCQQTME